jgi:aldehyde:ferredoxin oxidoreductase
MFGYAGQILKIDLTTGKIAKEELKPEIARKFIGGIGMGAKLLSETVKPNTDALSPENALIYSAGALSGTVMPGAGKTNWVSKSPLTGVVQTSAAGDMGANLKWAGYDSMVITGKADRPVYITIFDDDVRINDASDLWGKDVHDSADQLWDKYGDDCSIITIGPAGEKLARISQAFTNKISTGGREGSGAAQGSKNLKAIVVKGTKGIKVAHTEEFLQKADEIYDRFLQDPLLKQWMDLGSSISLEQYGQIGNVVWKNWRESYPADKYVSRFGAAEEMKIKEVSIPCMLCPLGCKLLYNLREGEFKGLETLQSCNMGATLSFGGNFDLLNYNQIAKCQDTCNRLGLDSVETCYVLSFLMDLQEKGIIDEKVTDGMKLERNLDTILTWMPRIANREGFGNVIADGYPGVFAALGPEVVKYAIQIKGGTPDFDSRSIFGTEAFGGAVGVKGPHCQLALGQTVITGRKPDSLERYTRRIGMPDEAAGRVFTGGPEGFNVARLTKYIEGWNTLMECMGVCNRPPLARLYNVVLLTELYYLATDFRLEPAELLAASDRATTQFKLFNISQGATREDDSLPERYFTEPIFILGKETWLHDYYETKQLTKQDFEKLLGEYYDERGWDKNTGVPTEKTLAALGIAK